MTYASGLPLKASERALPPTLEGAFRRFESKIARRRRKRGLHQSYLVRATPDTIRVGKRMQGDREEAA